MDDIERKKFLEDVERTVVSSIKVITTQIKDEVDSKIKELHKSQELLGSQVLAFAAQAKRAEEVANEAKRISDSVKHDSQTMQAAMKAHTKLLEDKIGQIADENRVQTDTLTELVSGQEARTARAQETQDLVKGLGSQMQSLLASETERQKKEAVDAALKKDADARMETFWKRLPIWISLIVLISTILLWLFNTLLMQNRMMQQPQYRPMEPKSMESK